MRYVLLALLVACGGGTSAHESPGSAPDTQCPGGGALWCWVLPLPERDPLLAIGGTSPTNVWATGAGMAYHFDGSAWASYAPNNSSGTAPAYVFAVAPDDVWAGGGSIAHWDGSAWTIAQDGAHASSINALGGTGADDIWAYDLAFGDAWHWDGSAWTPESAPAFGPGVRPVKFGGVAGSDWAVGTNGGLAHWNGTGWDIVDAGSHPTEDAVILDDTHIVIAEESSNGDQDGSVAFWDGTTWTEQVPPDIATWNHIAATSFSDVSVTGFHSNPGGSFYYDHWDGTSWTSEPAIDGYPRGLWPDLAGGTWAVFDEAVVGRWDGTAWTQQTTGDNKVAGVWGSAEDDLWAVSAPARLHARHWDGTAWTETMLPSLFGDRFGKIFGTSPDDVWIAAGRGGDVVFDRYLFHWDGSSWASIGPLGTESADQGTSLELGFASVWASGADDVYAVGQTALYHFDGIAWAQIPGVQGTDVFGTAADDVYVCDGATLWHWDGNAWTSIATPLVPMPSPLLTVGWANSATDLWIGAGGTVAHYDGQTFTTLPVSGNVTSIVATQTDAYAISDNGDVAQWNAAGSASFATPVGQRNSGWIAPDGRLYIAGNGMIAAH